jgi:hypothetical protein
MDFPDALNPFRSLKAVWSAVKASPGPIVGWWAIGIGAAVVLYVLAYIPMVVMIAASEGRLDEQAEAAAGGVLLLTMIPFGLAMFVGQCWWRIGLLNVLADTLRTGRSELRDAWKRRGRLLAMIGTYLLVMLAMLGVYLPLVLCVALGAVLGKEGIVPEAAAAVLTMVIGLGWLWLLVYVGLGISLAPSAAALDDVGPGDALGRSWRAARGRRLALFVFWLGTYLCAISGLLLLCIGYLATIALVELMPAEAYLALTRSEERAGWWIATGAMQPASEEDWTEPQA